MRTVYLSNPLVAGPTAIHDWLLQNCHSKVDVYNVDDPEHDFVELIARYHGALPWSDAGNLYGLRKWSGSIMACDFGWKFSFQFDDSDEAMRFKLTWG